MCSHPSPESFLGIRVTKELLDDAGDLKPFGGTVEGYNPRTKSFRVAYDDGDSEDLNLEQLRPLVQCAIATAGGIAQGQGIRAAAVAGSGVNKATRGPAPKLEHQPKRKASSNGVCTGNATKAAKTTPAGAATAVASKPRARAHPAGSAKASASKPHAKATPAGAATAGASEPRAKASAAAPASLPGAATLGLPEVTPKTTYAWAHGQEPWRSLPELTVPVAESPIVDAPSRKAFQDCRRAYYKRYRQAEAEEAARVERDGGVGAGGKRLAKRPDRVTESAMKAAAKKQELGGAINQVKLCGFIPGLEVSQRFYARAEMAVLGLHHPPVAGISYVGKDEAGGGVPPFAVSVVVGGWYADDADQGAELVYTGAGANDLLGSRKQVAHQDLTMGANAALVGNIQLGLPVRVTRKNKDPHGLYGCVFLFDGLYDVVEYWQEVGEQGFNVCKYRMVRRPGQGALLSEQVRYGGIAASKQLTWRNRDGVVYADISGAKEERGIAAVNEADDGDLPPCCLLERVPTEEELLGCRRGISSAQL